MILLLFLGAFALVTWATFASIAGRVPMWARVSYLLTLVGCAIAAFFTTFRYTYLANANTRFHGWPVPTMVFQRDAPDAPWLDFVGPTVVLAYPMNLVLFGLVPAILFLIVYHLRKGSSPIPDNTLPLETDGRPYPEGRVRDTGRR